jgi:hypothetical protein
MAAIRSLRSFIIGIVLEDGLGLLAEGLVAAEQVDERPELVLEDALPGRPCC